MTHPQTDDYFGKIAVIGMAGRYPAAKDVDEFWKNLVESRDCVSHFTNEELIGEGIDRLLLERDDYVKSCGVFVGTYLFDAALFGVSPREAELLDPQHRIFLECSLEALENAGYDSTNYRGRIGLIAGCGMPQYLIELLSVPGITEVADGQTLMLSNASDFLATRVAYKLNLKGPCLTLQAGCSTSLVSIIQSCQSLLNYQADMMLAGGVSIETKERSGYIYKEDNILAPDGRCRAFDVSAQGTVGGSGVGVVVLKRFEDALRDHDTINALIVGTGLNNDGASRLGFTAPSVEGQVEAYTDALAMADVNPETIGFIECHGTGTKMGDPIEIAALTRAFRARTDKIGFCAVGSVKTNIGHTDVAAGVAGFTKAVLALKHRAIPASLHFRRANPDIDFDASPFYVNTAFRIWEPTTFPRRAAVTSLGLGGTNAHVILQEAPETYRPETQGASALIVLSANSEPAVVAKSQELGNYLAQIDPTISLEDVAYTLQTGRRPLPYRCCAVCQNSGEAAKALSSPFQIHFVGSPPEEVTFLFPGQGSQYASMGRSLYLTEKGFRDNVDRCATIAQQHLGYDIRDIITSNRRSPDSLTALVDQTEYAQMALFIFEYALAKLWMNWGVQPTSMLGHSLGEYTAACLAGVFTLDTALRLLAVRAQLMQVLPKGVMIAVRLSEESVRSRIQSLPGVSVAAVNGVEACVVAGPLREMEVLRDTLSNEGVYSLLLRTSHAFHSSMMDAIEPKFRSELRAISLNAPSIPYISNVTGTWITPTEATNPEYWIRHLKGTVRFSDGVMTLLKSPRQVFLEVGPSTMLGGIVKSHLTSPDSQIVLTSARGFGDGVEVTRRRCWRHWALFGPQV
jgi:acyl transferase domain-containing protein